MRTSRVVLAVLPAIVILFLFHAHHVSKVDISDAPAGRPPLELQDAMKFVDRRGTELRAGDRLRLRRGADASPH